MKRRRLLEHLRSKGCEQLREGGRHSWWHNPALNRRTAIPRHSEIDAHLARKIYRRHEGSQVSIGADSARSMHKR